MNQYPIWNRKTSVEFRKTNERWGMFSNMAASYPVYIDGKKWLTTEALYQACRYPDHPEHQEAIRLKPNPLQAKWLSRRFIKDTRRDWEDVKVDVMRFCLFLKMKQNPVRFTQAILSTADREIIEVSDSKKPDLFWGAKLSEDGMTFEGRNILGVLLMELRDKLRTNPNFHQSRAPDPKIPNLILLGKPIPMDSLQGVSTQTAG